MRAGRARERAKMALRSMLYRRNLNVVRDPFAVRVATAASCLTVDTVLDVGANLGQYGAGLRAGGYRGRLVSCEPLPDAYAELAKRAAADVRWTSVCAAVGSEPGTVEVNVAANSYSSSILPMTDAHLGAAPGSRYVGTVRVPMTTVAELIGSQSLTPARTLLKVDTQGYESPVLDGAGERLAEFAAVQLELSLVPLYTGQVLAHELCARLAGLDFTLFSLEGGFGDRLTGRMLQFDGLFVRRELLERIPDQR